MYLAIDGKPMIRQPHQIEVQPYGYDAGLTADQRPTVRPPGEYVTLNATWGRDASFEEVLAELERRRANRGVHAITFEPTRGGDRMTINCYIGKPRYTAVGQDAQGRTVIGAFTIPFIQVDPALTPFNMRIRLMGTISALSPFVHLPMPAPGRLISTAGNGPMDGSIATWGAGNTDIDAYIAGTLVAQGTFFGGAQMTWIAGTPDFPFAEGDDLEIDVPAAVGDSADAVLTLWCMIARP